MARDEATADAGKDQRNESDATPETATGASKDVPTGDRYGRRWYLQNAGGAALGLGALASGIGHVTAETTRRGIEFDRVVDAVDDLGLDPSGNELCDDAVRSALDGGNTLVRFTEGTYLFREQNVVSGGNVGVVGEGDVVFKIQPGVKPGSGGNLFVFAGVNQALWENVDIDISASDTTAGLNFRTDDGFVVDGLEYLGRGTHSSGDVPFGITAQVHNSASTGIIRNYVAKKGSGIGLYKSGGGRGGVYIGGGHYGTIEIDNCDLREFGNNGLYTSRTYGNVQVSDSYFENNNAANVRISGDGSYVENSTIVIDMDRYTGPRESLESSFNPRGVVIEQSKYNDKPGPAEVRNCDIEMLACPARTQGGICVQGQGRNLIVRNTAIRVDADGVPGVWRQQPSSLVGRPAPDPPYWVRMYDSVVHGNASSGQALRLDGAHGSIVQNCCIEQPGSNRDGVVFTDSNDCTVEDSAIDVGGTAIVQDSSTVSTSNVSRDAACDPDSVGNVDDPNDGSDDDGSEDDSLPHRLVLDGREVDEQVDYTFEVSEEVAAGSNANDNDVIDGTRVKGQLNGYFDDYDFAGELESLELSQPISVTVDGEEVVETFDGGSDGGHELTIVGDQGYAPYEFTVSGDLEHSDHADGATIDDNDTIEGSTATGQVNGGIDCYRFSGDVLKFTLEEPATVRLDGQEVDPDSLGEDGSTVLTIVGDRGKAHYEFAVSGDLEHSEADDATIDDHDVVEGSTASGRVWGWKDSYRFTGEIETFELDAPATVYLDGQEVDPVTLGTSLPHSLVLEGGDPGDPTTYRFAVTGDLAKGPFANDDDVVDGTAVEGILIGGKDDFQFSGEVQQLVIDGHGSLKFNDS